MATLADPLPRALPDLRVGALAVFVLLTFGITWTLVLLMIRAPELIESIAGPAGVTNPFYLLAVWAPAIAALTLILRRGGLAGLRRFLGRLLIWRLPLAWWAFALLALPALKMLGAALGGIPVSELMTVQPFWTLLGISAFMLVLGPMEEFGWRGVALPLLQRRVAPLWAGLAVGALWAVWHVPAFALGGSPQSAWSLAPFLIGVTAVGVVMTVAYNRTSGSLLLPILIHWQLNIAFWPEAQPWENYLNVALAAVLVWVHRDMMLGRTPCETEVIPAAP